MSTVQDLSELMSSRAITDDCRKAPGGVVYLGYQTNTEAGELRRIEFAARTCYKSEDNMNALSSEHLFHKLMERQHYAMIRFGERTVIMDALCWRAFKEMLTEYQQIAYWRWVPLMDTVAVTANLQCWYFLAKILAYVAANPHSQQSVVDLYKGKKEIFHQYVETIIAIFTGWPVMSHYIRKELETPDLEAFYSNVSPAYIEEPDFEMMTDGKHQYYKNLLRHTFRVVTDRGITHEIVRHTTLSYGQESTRYVRYDPKGDALPIWIPEHMIGHPAAKAFQDALRKALLVYNTWTTGLAQAEHLDDIPEKDRLVPGDARNFLPHCLKTEIVISGYLDESPIGKEFNAGLSHFVDMRYDKAAHKGIQPIGREVAKHLNISLDKI